MSTTDTNPTAAELVEQLADPTRRDAAWRALEALGADALPAVRAGLRDGRTEVRRWCAIHLDHHGDAQSREALVPLLRDPKSKVRLWAVHSISCDRCKAGDNTLDVVPLLEERVRQDESIRVRRMATAMLHQQPVLDQRSAALFRWVLDTAGDRKLRLHAAIGWMRCKEAGLVGKGRE